MLSVTSNGHDYIRKLAFDWLDLVTNSARYATPG